MPKKRDFEKDFEYTRKDEAMRTKDDSKITDFTTGEKLFTIDEGKSNLEKVHKDFEKLLEKAWDKTEGSNWVQFTTTISHKEKGVWVERHYNHLQERRSTYSLSQLIGDIYDDMDDDAENYGDGDRNISIRAVSIS